MEQNIQKYQLEQDNKIFILTTSLTNDDTKLKFLCEQKGIPLSFSQEYSINDLKKLHHILLSYDTLEEIQFELERSILSQLVGIYDNGKIFEIIFYMQKGNERARIPIRLKILNPIKINNNIKITPEKLDNLENEANEILKEQNKLKEEINNILTQSNFSTISKVFTFSDKNKNPKLNNKNNLNNNNNNNSNNKIVKNFINSDIIKTFTEYQFLTNKFQNDHVKFNLIYKATKDSDKAIKFHEKCDNIQDTLILVETGEGKRFGGFTTQKWEGDNVDKKDDDSFIFSLDKLKMYDINNGKYAIGCYPKFGPVFTSQIKIFNNAFSNGGSTYLKNINFRTEEDYELTGGNIEFTVKEIEVFKVIVF